MLFRSHLAMAEHASICDAADKRIDDVILGHARALSDALAKCGTVEAAERKWPGVAKLWALWRKKNGPAPVDHDAIRRACLAIPVGRMARGRK